MEVVQETVGREAVLVLAKSSYASTTEALFEIVDNPFDYRRGRHLNVSVTIEKKNRRPAAVSIVDYGGEGMDVESLRDWIRWGTGHQHGERDIGQYHMGGKLAAVYLGESIEILCRKAGNPQIFKFMDLHWGTRTVPYQGEVEILSDSALGWLNPVIAALPPETGFTQIRIENLNQHRYDTPILAERLANTYRVLIKNHQCTIVVDGQMVKPLEIPESSSYKEMAVDIPPRTRLSPGNFVSGRIWVMDRDKIPTRRGGTHISAGIRTLLNQRLVTEGETFGFNLAGRGSLQRLIGELHINGPQPTFNKNDWIRDTERWEELERFVRGQMQPLVSHLQQVSEFRLIPREQKKRTELVRRQLERVLERLRNPGAKEEELMGAGGRKRPRPNDSQPTEIETRTPITPREPVTKRTEPPNDSVGILLRKLREGGIPKIDYQDLGRVERSHWHDNRSTIVINTSYPMYDPSSDAYIAETVCVHLLKEDELFSSQPPKIMLEELDRVLWLWSEIRESDLD